MSALLPDRDLLRWAREHLVYEARMLAYATVRLYEMRGRRDPETNAHLESFAVHARCLRDFLWADRGRHPDDAFAADFCTSGAWEQERGSVPPTLRDFDDRDRAGREVVHLTYHRLDIDRAAKGWRCDLAFAEIAEALKRFAELAQPQRLDPETKRALQDLSVHSEDVGAASVATGAYYGGTIPFQGFTSRE